MKTLDKNCPCSINKTYDNCCGKIHSNINNASTAEELMRSRYSAFVKANGEYLNKSHHSSTRPNSKKQIKEIVAWAKSVTWIKLEIIGTKKGLLNDLEGTVEFKAYFIEGGIVKTIHENSKFVRENKHWVYLGAN